MRNYSLNFPEHFDEQAPIIAAKGWIDGVVIVAGDRCYRPEFYDPPRFAQTVADDVDETGMVVPHNIVVIPKVTREHVEEAARRLAEADFVRLRPMSD